MHRAHMGRHHQMEAMQERREVTAAILTAIMEVQLVSNLSLGGVSVCLSIKVWYLSAATSHQLSAVPCKANVVCSLDCLHTR